MTISTLGTYLVLILGSYLLGSFPTGYVIGRLHGIDIRKFGSGKTGGTNVLRTLGWGAMAVVAVIDVAKGFVPVMLAQQFTGSPLVVVLCGLGAVVGHNWPLYIKFRGGSGTGTGFGVLIAMAPVVAVTLTVFFLVPVILTRYMSLGSIMAATAAPIIVTLFAKDSWLPPEYAYFALAGAALVLWRHRANMRRLLAGKEAKIGERVEIAPDGASGEAE